MATVENGFLERLGKRLDALELEASRVERMPAADAKSRRPKAQGVLHVVDALRKFIANDLDAFPPVGAEALR